MHSFFTVLSVTWPLFTLLPSHVSEDNLGGIAVASASLTVRLKRTWLAVFTHIMGTILTVVTVYFRHGPLYDLHNNCSNNLHEAIRAINYIILDKWQKYINMFHSSMGAILIVVTVWLSRSLRELKKILHPIILLLQFFMLFPLLQLFNTFVWAQFQIIFAPYLNRNFELFGLF